MRGGVYFKICKNKKYFVFLFMTNKTILSYFLLKNIAVNDIIKISSSDLENLLETDKSGRRKIIKSLVNNNLINVILNPGGIQSYRIRENNYGIPNFINKDIPKAIKSLACTIYFFIDDYNNCDTLDKVLVLLNTSKTTLNKFYKYIIENPLEITNDVYIKEMCSVKRKIVSNVIIEENVQYRVCTICNNKKNVNLFYKANKNKCKSCCIEYQNSWLGKQEKLSLNINPKSFFTKKLKLNKYTSKSRGIENKLSENDLYEIYKKQKGNCFYSNLPFEEDNKHRVISIDRIDSSKGYTKDNVVLCLNIINKMKNNLTTNEFKEYIKLINNNLNNF